MKNLTWKCGVCHEDRPDEKISVLSYPMRTLPGATINLKHCNDKPECIAGASEKAGAGKL